MAVMRILLPVWKEIPHPGRHLGLVQVAVSYALGPKPAAISPEASNS